MDAAAPRRNKNGSRISRFTLTLNNWTDAEFRSFTITLASICKWAVLGKEKGEKGTPHLQGAGVLNKQTAFSSICSQFPRAHIEVMRGSPQQNLDYCTKEDKTAWQTGTLPQPGKRTDLHDVAELIESGASMRDVAESHPTAVIKFSKGLMVLRSILSGPRNPEKPPSVYWLFGPTGSGKTRGAFGYGCATYGETETLIMPDATLKWFDTYDGQKCVIFDDFRSKGVTFSFLLRVLDRYPVNVPIKGAFVNWNPECIFITTPNDIKTTFAKRFEHVPEDIKQLERRVTQVIEFPIAGGQSLSDRLLNGPGVKSAFDIIMGSGSTGVGLEQPVDLVKRPALTKQFGGHMAQCIACGDVYVVTNTNQRFCNDCVTWKK